ncbi:hypothetical protein DFH11DRAFT_418740 [Phellopilus nigrolimitatus]|nr:hypothetical protein DFH11DRAFT_418740 [Phellopilus nigrolimitatus]
MEVTDSREITTFCFPSSLCISTASITTRTPLHISISSPSTEPFSSVSISKLTFVASTSPTRSLSSSAPASDNLAHASATSSTDFSSSSSTRPQPTTSSAVSSLADSSSTQSFTASSFSSSTAFPFLSVMVANSSISPTRSTAPLSSVVTSTPNISPSSLALVTSSSTPTTTVIVVSVVIPIGIIILVCACIILRCSGNRTFARHRTLFRRILGLGSSSSRDDTVAEYNSEERRDAQRTSTPGIGGERIVMDNEVFSPISFAQTTIVPKRYTAVNELAPLVDESTVPQPPTPSRPVSPLEIVRGEMSSILLEMSGLQARWTDLNLQQQLLDEDGISEDTAPPAYQADRDMGDNRASSVV